MARARSTATDPLGAGQYSYKAFVADNANYVGANSGCEPFNVVGMQLVMSSTLYPYTTLFRSNGSVPLGSVMHDTGRITDGLVDGFSPAPITFRFYANGTCTVGGSPVGTVGA